MEDNFEIIVFATKYKVQVYYSSAVVIRFKLTLEEGKEINLEKRLLQKQNAWKVLGVTYRLADTSENMTRNLFEMFHVLDEKITGNSRVTYRNPQERNSYK